MDEFCDCIADQGDENRRQDQDIPVQDQAFLGLCGVIPHPKNAGIAQQADQQRHLDGDGANRIVGVNGKGLASTNGLRLLTWKNR